MAEDPHTRVARLRQELTLAEADLQKHTPGDGLQLEEYSRYSRQMLVPQVGLEGTRFQADAPSDATRTDQT
jgi:hypothetical protein